MKDHSKKVPIKFNLKKHLNADALFLNLYSGFQKIPDNRPGKTEISLADALMSGFSMFSLKEPSLLAFDNRRMSDNNLRSVYLIKDVPCDTRMREILDEVVTEYLRPSFKNLFRVLQRSKALEQLMFMDGYYLVSLDGTGFFSSSKLKSSCCLEKKNKKTGAITYHQQLLGVSVVHPEFKEVIPLMPEMIIKQDGETKNDCERNAAKRLLKALRKDHPHLKMIIIEDGLSSNAPHIRALQNGNFSYILGVKSGDHFHLFDYVNSESQKANVTEFQFNDKENPKITHRFRFMNNVPLNKSNSDLKVNFIEYWEISDKKIQHFSWVTDFKITPENAYQLMRGGRARWKIENETFNTLKNQGYHFEHNFGLGKKNLSSVFAFLMMLAFLVDQIQQLSCNLFRSAWRKKESKRSLWDTMRSYFLCYSFNSMSELLLAIYKGVKLRPPIIDDDTS